MKIEHLALWVSDIERMKEFYINFFGGTPNQLYHNPVKNFTSYFISFSSGCRLELMHRPDIRLSGSEGEERIGITHFSISVGSMEAVDRLTKKIADSGYSVVGQPRTTGDGYYESVVLDPEGNRIEIAI